MTINVNWFKDRCTLYGDKLAVIDPENHREFTYHELYQRALNLTLYLQDLGVQKGDRLAILAPNHVAFLDLIISASMIGFTLVPLNWRLAGHELAGIIADCQPKYIFYSTFRPHTLSEIKAILEPEQFLMDIDSAEYELTVSGNPIESQLKFEPVDQEDILFLIYTSGTTGQPKGVMISHRHMIHNCLITIPSWGLSNQDRTVTFSPMFHIAGLHGLVLPLLFIGGSIVIQGQFDSHQAIEYIDEYQPTVIFMVPTMYYSLIDQANFREEAFKSLRFLVSGGAPMSAEVYQVFMNMDLPIVDSYGLTEAGSNNFFMAPAYARLKRGSIGRPNLLVPTKIVDESGLEVKSGEIGELLIGGPATFSGYWNKESLSVEVLDQGFVHTGDLFRKDDDGYYYVVGRSKDMVITGGENVYPSEVEQVLNQHEAVRECVVYGYRNPKWGESVAAAVIVNQGYQGDADQLNEFMTERIAGYKTPKVYLFLEEFPTNSIGKINKQALESMTLDYLK
ncbi:class I adenylate-forming enzyme family protein [Hutsoniella sourekii]